MNVPAVPSPDGAAEEPPPIGPTAIRHERPTWYRTRLERHEDKVRRAEAARFAEVDTAAAAEDVATAAAVAMSVVKTEPLRRVTPEHDIEGYCFRDLGCKSSTTRLIEDYINPLLCASGGLSLIHISEPTRLLSNSNTVFCLKKKKHTTHYHLVFHILVQHNIRTTLS